ncbi:MAG: aspartyl-tRNA ligase [candidate division TM6 bacterium GW2011_GWE2_41_16]|nr:MAG: aspartyl-tRNA ligase [candidate division TM6 bacterium GW2011_GWE2_41_16]
MEYTQNTVPCGKVCTEHVGSKITLRGWVNRRRDHGTIIFIDLRDRSGLMQLVISPDLSKDVHTKAQEIRSEYVIVVEGTVVKRSDATINKNLPTGEFELQVSDLQILSRAKTLPFQLEEAKNVDEELRLRYRYIDLRRPEMLEIFALRHRIIFAIREFLNKEDFYEVETPILTKNTAEGAREFLVPSRNIPGSFYALPQSPQVYKQLLMAGGFEKYFQIARCFRDESNRADRQPEFTQMDLEMSFTDEKTIQTLIESLLSHVYKTIFGKTLQLPMRRMRYDDAMRLYGCDKPDLRFDLPIQDITKTFESSPITFIQAALKKGGKVGALHIQNKNFSRSELESWTNKAKIAGAQGLIWMRIGENDVIESSIVKHLPTDIVTQLRAIIPTLAVGDTLFVIAGDYKQSWTALGRLRLQLGKALDLIANRDEFLWVTDFPLLEWNEEGKRWVSAHHPFTRPQEGWENKKPEDIKARSYDIVLNGVELGSGSIRIHEKELQYQIFNFLGLDADDMKGHFGFLLEAQELGFPPHGGIALGLDRFLMLMLGLEDIRDIIAFPKTGSGSDLLMGAPTPVSDKKLKDYALVLKQAPCVKGQSESHSEK